MKPTRRAPSIANAFSTGEKLTIGVAGLSAVFLLLIIRDIRWTLGCLSFLMVVALSTTVAFLKGRNTLAAAGAGSVIAFAAGLAAFWWVARQSELTPPGSYGLGVLFVFGILWTVGPLMLVALAGAIWRASPGSPWAMAATASQQVDAGSVSPVDLDEDLPTRRNGPRG